TKRARHSPQAMLGRSSCVTQSLAALLPAAAAWPGTQLNGIDCARREGAVHRWADPGAPAPSRATFAPSAPSRLRAIDLSFAVRWAEVTPSCHGPNLPMGRTDREQLALAALRAHCASAADVGELSRAPPMSVIAGAVLPRGKR